MLATLTDPGMWTALFKIAVINVVLSGDNAVVIALACRSLAPKQQRNAFAVGTAGIVVLMTILTAFAAYLMTLPYLQIIGSLLLLWIGVKLLLPEDEEGNIKDSNSFWEAVKTIIIADIVMSLDNVLGMAGAANGHLGMLFVGLLITMPLILFGSAMLMKLMERLPALVTVGAGLLGYVAGDMAVADLSVKHYVEVHAHALDTVAPIIGAAFVVIAGNMIARRRAHDAGATPEPEVKAQPAVKSAAPGGMDSIVVPIGEGHDALRAVEEAIAMYRKEPVRIHLLNVQPAMPRHVSRFFNANDLHDFHRDTGMQALQPAREMLDRAGVPHQDHVLVGNPAQTIVGFADEHRCVRVVLDDNGPAGLLPMVGLGSVGSQVRHLMQAAAPEKSSPGATA
jgi:YjbE family integral membrane protein